MCRMLGSLMDHQGLDDIVICCGTNTIHAHKSVLSANSQYFHEQFEKNSHIEQIIISGMDFPIVQSLIEFMYCGKTNILNENLKYIVAAAKLFRMGALQTLAQDYQDIQLEAGALQNITPPVFASEKPKYPNVQSPVNNVALPLLDVLDPLEGDQYFHSGLKRKYIESDLEEPFIKQEDASQFTLEALQEELANTSLMNSFGIDDSFAEASIENFISNSEDSYIGNLNQMEAVPIQIVNYNELNNSLNTPAQVINFNNVENIGNVPQFEVDTFDKSNQIFGAEMPGDIGIMYTTSEGNFVTVAESIFQNFFGGAPQYQIVNDNENIGDIQELQLQTTPTYMPDFEVGPNVVNSEESVDSYYCNNGNVNNRSLYKTFDEVVKLTDESDNAISSNMSLVTAGMCFPKIDEEDPFIEALNSSDVVSSHSDLKESDLFSNLLDVNNENCSIYDNVDQCRSIQTNFASGNTVCDFNLIGDSYMYIPCESPQHEMNDSGVIVQSL